MQITSQLRWTALLFVFPLTASQTWGDMGKAKTVHGQQESAVTAVVPGEPAPRHLRLFEETGMQSTSTTSLATQAAVGLATLATEQVSAPGSADKRPAAARAEQSAAAVPIRPETGSSSGKTSSAPSDEDYVIGPQDVLAITVWREAELSRAVPVRPDGKISLPLVGEMKASGLTPRVLQAQIAKVLELYLQKPKVVVIIQEPNSHKFNIIGEVQRPGSYPLAGTMSVVDALAAAGGFRDFARVKRTYLLRRMPDGSRKRIAFNYREAVKGRKLGAELELMPGDTIVVP